MMDPSGSLEVDEMDEDDIFDEDADANEEDMDDELSQLGEWAVI